MSIEPNQSYKINSVCKQNQQRFRVIGLHPNAVLKIKSIQPFNGPIVIEVDRRLIGLRRIEFACLTLTKV